MIILSKRKSIPSQSVNSIAKFSIIITIYHGHQSVKRGARAQWIAFFLETGISVSLVL